MPPGRRCPPALAAVRGRTGRARSPLRCGGPTAPTTAWKPPGRSLSRQSVALPEAAQRHQGHAVPGTVPGARGRSKRSHSARAPAVSPCQQQALSQSGAQRRARPRRGDSTQDPGPRRSPGPAAHGQSPLAELGATPRGLLKVGEAQVHGLLHLGVAPSPTAEHGLELPPAPEGLSRKAGAGPEAGLGPRCLGKGRCSASDQQGSQTLTWGENRRWCLLGHVLQGSHL